MGVSGCGKSTVGKALAARLGGRFLEGDDFHPPANKRFMGAGVPLTDEERWPWFDNLRAAIETALSEKGLGPVVVSCSALKRSYRDYLLEGFDARARLVFLEGSFDLIYSRMKARDHEYMPASLLESQFSTLEDPDPDEPVIRLNIAESPEILISELVRILGS